MWHWRDGADFTPNPEEDAGCVLWQVQGYPQSQRLEGRVSLCQRAQWWLQTHNPSVWPNVWASCPLLRVGCHPTAPMILSIKATALSYLSISIHMFCIIHFLFWRQLCSVYTAYICVNSHGNLFYYARTRSLINICWYVAIAVRSFCAKSVRVCHLRSLSRCRGAGPERSFYVWRPLLAPLTATSTTTQLCLNQPSAVIPLQDSSWLRE